MSFPTNTSPYGMQQQNQSGNKGTGGGIGQYFSPAYALYNNRNNGGLGQSLYQGLFGKPEQNYQQSTLGPEQQSLYNQMLQANQQRGAGGSFGQSADYYRDLLDPNSQTAEMMFAPEQRRFNEDIIPGLAEQFAAMGSGGLSSSGFRNAAVNAGTDLSERLGAIRAQLRQQGAQGLSQMGQFGLGNFNENINRPETYGLAGSFAEGAGRGLGQAAGTYLGGKF